MFVEGQPAILFVEGPKGSQAAPWISAGPVYEFRLYPGKAHEVLLAFVKVTRGNPPDLGALSVFVLWHYAALLGLVWLSYGLGRRLTRWCEYQSGLEQFVFCTGFGLGIMALLLFFLGILGAIYRSFVLIAIVLLVVTCRDAGKELLIGLRRWPWKTRLHGVLAAATAVVILLPVLLVPLYPPTAFDAIMYHLPYARSYVEGHAVSPVLEARFPVFPQVNEMLFTLALLLVDDVAAQLIQFLMMLLVSLTVYAWASRRHSPLVGLWAASLWLSSPIVLRLAGWAFIDIGLACFATLSAFALFGGFPNNRLHSSIMAGAFAGLAAGTKYSGLFFVAALGLTTLILAIRERKVRYAAGFGLAVLVTGAPWYVYNAYHSGNPFLPFLGRFFGSGFWSPLDTGYIETLIDGYGTGDSVSSLLGLPWSLSFGDFPQRAELSPLYFASLPVLLLAAVFDHRLRALVLLSLGFILFWFWTVPVVRYLLPILPVLSVAIAAVFDRLVLRLPLPGRNAPAAIAGACALVLVLPAWQSAAKIVDAGLPPVTQQDRDRYLGRLVSYRTYQFLNDLRGSDYTLYALYSEDMVYYAKGRVMGDWFGPARFSRIHQKLANGEGLYGELRQLGADYFLVRTDRWPVKLPDDEFFRTHFQLVHSEANVQLYQLAESGR